MKNRFSTLSALLLAAVSQPPAMAWANTPQSTQEDDESLQDIVVTGTMRVRQGGAQDIKHFRDTATSVSMPRPEALTIEGLMGEHDLALPSSRACDQLFCLVTEVMPANFVTRPDDRLLVGLGFASNIDAGTWKRDPLNLVAVVDKSGSMSGTPLHLVRESLKKIVAQMGSEDRMSIILYGDTSHVYLTPTTIGGHRDDVLTAIEGIASAGSTAMEEGLRVGYETAFADAPGFRGNTRMMLFTDEQPNVGRTDAQSFMTMAEAASKKGIGLTTIGVGVQFNDTLATKVSSTRGGNLFFVASDADVKTTFEKQLDTVVSELAHDIVMTLAPVSGYRISAIFGVPADTMTDMPEGAVKITVPTAFLSANGGGIFVAMSKAGDRADLPAATLSTAQSALDVALTYADARTGTQGKDQLSVRWLGDKASRPMQTAHLLVDEYLAMRAATTAFHIKGNPKEAYSLLNGLSARLAASDLPGLEGERKLVGDMLTKAAYYSGYAGEVPKAMRPVTAMGMWEITSVDGFTDLRRGDRLEFTDDREMNTYRKQKDIAEVDESEGYEINEREVHLVDSRLVLSYRAAGDRMTLRSTDVGPEASISLRRVASAD
jgi:Ca-activated chloride channel homolog